MRVFGRVSEADARDERIAAKVASAGMTAKERRAARTARGRNVTGLKLLNFVRKNVDGELEEARTPHGAKELARRRRASRVARGSRGDNQRRAAGARRARQKRSERHAA